MKPIEFPEMNRVWAKDQLGYQPLPAYSDDQQTISCWRLTWRERLTVLLRGRLWLLLLNYGRPLTPSLISVEPPFIVTTEATDD